MIDIHRIAFTYTSFFETLSQLCFDHRDQTGHLIVKILRGEIAGHIGVRTLSLSWSALATVFLSEGVRNQRLDCTN